MLVDVVYTVELVESTGDTEMGESYLNNWLRSGTYLRKSFTVKDMGP